MTIIIKGVTMATMQAQQTQPRTRRSSKQDTSGRLGKFMPQISHDKNIKINNKHAMKNSWKIKTKHSHVPHDTCDMCHACNTCWMSNTVNQLTPSRATTKQAWAATTTTKTKITIFMLIKIESRLCCCGVLCKSDHRQPSWVKRAKRKICFLHSWMTISISQTPSYWTWFHWCRPQRAWWHHESIQSWQIRVHRYIVELVKVLQVQIILKSNNTNQDYTMTNICLV